MASASASYRVVYPFGAFSSADPLPATNTANAGSAVPVKFSLGSNRGLNIFAAGYPASGPIACTDATVGAVQPASNPGNSSVSVDSGGRHNFVWKTEKSWAGTCRMFVLRLNDGTDHLLRFKFR